MLSLSKKPLEQYILINDISCLQGEAFQKLQFNLQCASIDKIVNVIAVTSALQGDGKSTTCANLANIYALRGKKTIIVDLDLRRPTIHRFFKVENKNGITEFCSGLADKGSIIKKTESGLDVIVCGEKTPFPTKVLESEKLANLIKELKTEYDYVIVDTPPVLVVADSSIINRFVDGFIDVVVSNRTKKSDIKESIRLFKQNEYNILGTVLTQTKVNNRGYYYYYRED